MVDMEINTRQWSHALDEVKYFFNEACGNFIFARTLHANLFFKHVSLMLVCVLSFVCRQM
jgi:hypothetical protein